MCVCVCVCESAQGDAHREKGTHLREKLIRRKRDSGREKDRQIKSEEGSMRRKGVFNACGKVVSVKHNNTSFPALIQTPFQTTRQ